MRNIARIVFFILLLPLVFHAQIYNFRNFSIEDGLSQSQVLSLCQDSKGNIVFGTNSGGVSIYDGVKFTVLNENDGLLNNVVFSVTELKNGNLACGTNGGLSIYNGKRFMNYGAAQGFKFQRIYDVEEDENGKLWLGTEQGVYLLDPATKKAEEFVVDSTLSGASVFNIFRDSKSNWWLSTIGFGVVRVSPAKEIKWFNTANGLLDNFIRVVGEDKNGRIFIGANTGIHRIENDRPVLVDLPYNTSAGFTAILPESKSVTWFASNTGLMKWENGKVKTITVSNGLVSNDIWSAMQDREGNLWIATNGSGAARFLGEYNYNFVFNKETDDNVQAVFEDRDQNTWITVKNKGVYCVGPKGNITNLTLDPEKLNTSLKDNTVHAVVQDKLGYLWFGTISGLSRLDISNGISASLPFKNFAGAEGLADSSVISLHVDRKGILWIGTENGLYRYEDGKIVREDAVNKLSGNELFTLHNIHEDNGGIIWIGTEKGVIKYNRKTAERIDKAKGFTDRRVYTIVDDSKGNLLFATDEGLFYYDHGSFSNVLKELKDQVHSIFSILLDADENVWMGTSKGIDKFNLKSYRQHESTIIKHFGYTEGLRGLECNQNAAMIDSQKRVWFGTIKGSVVFDPVHERKNDKEAILHLSAIKLFYQPFDFSAYAASVDSITGFPSGLELPYDKNHVTFDFIGVCQTNPTKVKYIFKLEGLDDDWYPPASKNEITYSSLQPGNYTFHLKAMNNDGVWNKEALKFSFRILPPWYRTWWFYTLCALIAGASIYGFITVRTKNLEKQKRVLEEQVTERTRELREEKEKVELINAEVISQKGIIEAKNKDITDSINYAKNIQEALMPSVKILEESFEDSFALYMPKDIVSGDFYWFAKRGGKHFFAAVDCTGHGVPGAFMSIIGNSLLHEIVSEKNISQPAKILDDLHSGVKEALNANKGDTERRDGMDIALCAWNPETGILEYAGANRPLWIFRGNKNAGEHESMKPNKFPIGGLELEQKREFTHHEVKVSKGDCVYVFTDGYADQFGGERGKKFMLGNLQKALEQIHSLPMKEQRKILFKTFSDWKGEHEQIDDVLVIGVRF